jgi:hypothetical protein
MLALLGLFCRDSRPHPIGIVAKSDRLDSILLARLPMLHPEGLHPGRGLGPGDPLRRATQLHSTLVKRRTTSLARLDALLEILGPDWHAAFKVDLANKTPLRFLAAGYAAPHTVNGSGKHAWPPLPRRLG